jgi:hypothetical protein
MKRIGVPVVVLFLISTLSLWPVVPAGVPSSCEAPQAVNQVAGFIGGKVLCDESHVDRGSDMWTPGNASMFGWLLQQYGYSVSTNWNSPLDSGILGGCKVLCLFFPMVALTPGEVTAVWNFVSSGGGLLLVGIDYTASGWMYTPANLNPVSQTYGITFRTDSVLGRSLRSGGDISSHNVTLDVQSFHSQCDQVYGCGLTVTGPATSLAVIRGESVLAVAQNGSGRVVAVGSPAPFVIYRHDPGWQVNPNDHFQLTLNIIDWLVGNPHRVAQPPEKAIFRIGSGPSLNSTEVDEYTLFNGVIHEHTTHSDGGDTAETMVIAGLLASLDYFVITDHIHAVDIPGGEGIYGALDARGYVQTYGLDCPIIVGAELSNIEHTVGFPLTANIITSNQTAGINLIHAQGGIAGMAHPDLDSSEIPVWEAYSTYGFDAFEVMNSGFFQGLGESCYFRSFYGASDTHAASGLGYIRNVVFIKNPTGPNGAASGNDVANAVVNRRIVVLDLINRVIFGQGVWVDRFLQVWNQAEAALNNTRNQIESLEGGVLKLGLSRMYLEKAETAMKWWNPSASLKATDDALLSTVTGLDLNTTARNLGVIAPGGDVALSVKLENRHGYGVALNATPFVNTAMTFDNPSTEILAGPSSTHTTSLTGTATSFGYTRVLLNLHDFNTTEKPNPILLQVGGIISNVTVKATNVTTGTELSVKLLVRRGDSLMISSAQISYNNGTAHIAGLTFDGEGYGITLGPFAPGVNVTFQILIDDALNNSFVINGGTYLILGAAGPSMLEWALIIGIGAVGVVLVIVVVLHFRKKT